MHLVSRWIITVLLSVVHKPPTCFRQLTQVPRARTLGPGSFVFWLPLYNHYEILYFILERKRLEFVRVWFRRVRYCQRKRLEGPVRYSEPLHIGKIKLLSVYIDEPARAQERCVEVHSLRLLYDGP